MLRRASRSLHRSHLPAALVWLCVILVSNSAHGLPPTTDLPAPPDDGSSTPAQSSQYFPTDWQIRVVKEPVLGSSMFMVTAGDKRHPPLVLLHGLGQNGLLDWMPIIEALKDQHYIVAVDFPGFGRSSRTTDRLSPENFAAIVHWLVQTEKLDNIHLAGHSMGGAVALYYAAHYPANLQQLTLIDVAGVLHRTAFVKSMADVDQRAYSFLPDAIARHAARVLDWSDSLIEKINLLPDLTQPLRKNDLAWNYLLNDQPNTNAALSLINTDYSHIVDAISTPTTIIWGARDPVAPLRTGFMLNGLIPNSQIHVLPDAKHVPIKTHTATVVALMQGQNEGKRKPPANTPKQALLECNQETGKRYSGHYKKVILSACMDIVMADLQADTIEINNSVAELTRVRVKADERALLLRGSAVSLTAVRLEGPTAIEMHGSRVDMAGTQLYADQAALRIHSQSVVVASVSNVTSPGYTGKLHGATRARNMIGETLMELHSRAKPVANTVNGKQQAQAQR